MKKLISLLLSISILFSTTLFASAKSDNVTITEPDLVFSATPIKQDFAKGEKIVFSTSMTNESYSDLSDVLVWVEEADNNTYLANGGVKTYYSVLEYRENYVDQISIGEDEGTVQLGEKSGALAPVMKFAVKIYSRLWAIVSTMKTAVANCENIRLLLQPRKTKEIQRCTVNFDGKPCELVFKMSYPTNSIKPDFKSEKLFDTDNEFGVKLKIKPSEFSGIYFGCDENNLNGAFFYIDGTTSSVGVARITADGLKILTRKYLNLDNKFYDCKLTYCDGRIKAWVYNNPLDEDPYPVVDIYEKLSGSILGKYGLNLENVTSVELTEAEKDPAENTYSNPVMINAPDPGVVYDNGYYYMYSTNAPGEGFIVDVSTDLVHWERKGFAAQKPDIFGDSNFWAPEVYKYNGEFYMIYTVDGVMAIAKSDSPLGPFKKVNDDYLLGTYDGYDGHIFFDDDGRKYLYYSHTNESNGNHEIWGVELGDDLVTVKWETNKRVCAPKGWENYMNEAPTMLKHNGTYYLTYSGNDCKTKMYGVGIATGDSPLADFKKTGSHELVRFNSYIHGTGHHTFVTTESGEMYIVYHCHENLQGIGERKCCVDRVKFVPTESGTDELVAYGPTVTTQPMVR